MPNMNYLDAHITAFSRAWHGRQYALPVMAASWEITENPSRFVTVGGVIDVLCQPYNQLSNPHTVIFNELQWLLRKAHMLSLHQYDPDRPRPAAKQYERTDSGLWRIVPDLIEQALAYTS